MSQTVPVETELRPRRQLRPRKLDISAKGTHLDISAGWDEKLSPVALWLRFGQHHWVPLEAEISGENGTWHFNVDLESAPSQAVAKSSVSPLGLTTEAQPPRSSKSADADDSAGDKPADEDDSVEDADSPVSVEDQEEDAVALLPVWPTDLATGSWIGRATLYVECDDLIPEDTGVVDQEKSPSSLPEGHGLFLLGRAHETHLAGALSFDTASPVTVYCGRRGFITLWFNAALTPHQAVVVHSLRMHGSHMRMIGELRHRHARATDAWLELTERGTETVHSARVALGPNDVQWQRDHYGHDRRTFEAEFDFAETLREDLPADMLVDARIRTEFDGAAPGELASRVGRTRFKARQMTNEGSYVRGDEALKIIPYYTVKAKNTSFRLERFSAAALAELAAISRKPLVSYGKRSQRPVWLIGEQPLKAQDSGAVLFRYLRNAHPEIDAYYVLDAASPDRAEIQDLDHIVDYRSAEHIRLAATAEALVGTHHPDYLLPTRSEKFQRVVRATKVFLQHGVIGMKWLNTLYGRKVPSFSTDLFMVSSEREKQLVVRDLGYDPDMVKPTGLPRFDQLFDGTVQADPHKLLIMPTWRPWLQTDDGFQASQYFEAWRDLLSSDRLRALAEEQDLDIMFLLHPNMSTYKRHFEDLGATVAIQGEVNIQQMLREAGTLITDYSSVAWDFSFLHKPVVFYQFDSKRMFRGSRPHADLAKELPGPIVRDLDGVLDALDAIAAADFTMDEHYIHRADRFIADRDTLHSERVFQAIRDTPRPALPTRPQAVGELENMLFRRFRKSKYYHPLMRTMYKVVSKFPADHDLIVFEAGLGRQLNDSPKAIYDELVRRGDPRRKVWSYNRRMVFDEPTSEAVLRLSPRYFWTIARAGAFVTNQNPQFYITRGPGRTFVETWHGTPLKKMARDIEVVHGRSEGYIDRVTLAAKQWSVLISPNHHTTAALRSAYGYEGPAVDIGSPRNDALVLQDHAEVRARILDEYDIPSDAKVILYAPTFRDDQPIGRGNFAFELAFDPEEFAAHFGPDTVLLLRMHMLSRLRTPIPRELAGRIINVSRYPEIQDLYSAADVLVTDYSSVFFDYSILKRPMVFFAPDLENYREELRGFYLDYESTVPGEVVTTQEGLFSALDRALVTADAGDDPRVSEFSSQFNPHADGHSAERVVDRFLQPRKWSNLLAGPKSLLHRMTRRVR
ncbi:CDP-glycerol glycerophosphotransferase family protein [Galactobacter sp.]|uniref:CDP-glycerol glycerophosphotransferase family protein n=1 Tax=Galactobacter sp. TaxID=2676125 RepID=UPI0025BE2DE7|nr:CDP-glycerol glycerophosphotransferase family protein [Galactobacter sp.]